MQQQPAIPSWTLTNLSLQRGRLYDPFAHADALNIQVLHRQLTQSNELWIPNLNTIFLKSGMRPSAQRCALAHGIGHASLGHVTDDPKSEAQADRYASVFLINPIELEDACRWEYDPALIAAELGVTRRLLDAYLGWSEPGVPRIAPSLGSFADRRGRPTGSRAS